MKKLLIFLSVIFAMAGIAGVLSACNGNGQTVVPQEQTETPSEETPENTQLVSPSNLQWDTETWTLSWDAVEGAESYVICATELAEYYYSDENYCNLEHKLTTNLTINVMVHSVCGGETSDWSEELTVKTETSSSMLAYTLLEDGSGYEVDRLYSNINYGLSGRVVIADYCKGLPVKSIAETAFRIKGIANFDTETGKYCNTVTTSFHLPKYLESIGNSAFAYCLLIEELNLPDGVTSIGTTAFSGCINLKKINNFPDNITSIPNAVFTNTAIESFSISENILSIGVRAFSGCGNLTEIVIPDSVTQIGISAFSRCVNLTEIVIPDSVTEIGNAAFYGCVNLAKITLYGDIQTIGRNTFVNCSSLTTVAIYGEVTSIGQYAFDGCSSLTDIIIPDSLTSVAEYAFDSCTALTNVYYAGSASGWNQIEIGSNNDSLTSSTVYCFAEDGTATEVGNYWYYDNDGNIKTWSVE